MGCDKRMEMRNTRSITSTKQPTEISTEIVKIFALDASIVVSCTRTRNTEASHHVHAQTGLAKVQCEERMGGKESP